MAESRAKESVGILLTELIEQYIFSRDAELDTFKLLVFHENASWDERILQNLEDAEIELESFSMKSIYWMIALVGLNSSSC